MLRHTPLHAMHVSMGARMGEFAGYDMPLFYKDGVMKEHEWTRSHCGIFDVSHMGQALIEGPDVVELLERLTPSNFRDKKVGRAQYTVLTNDKGGIIDDLIITKLSDKEFFAVINAGRKDVDIAWMKKHLSLNQHLFHMKDHALIAVQGRWAERVIHEIFDYNASDMGYMTLVKAQTKYGVPVFISRLGYTGEDGFEVSVPKEEAQEVWQAMLAHSEVRPIGLAARDSLRLEMGYPLYGHDINEDTSPIEADLGWVMGKGENKTFIGNARILKEKENGPSQKRVGIKLLDKGVAREGAEIKNAKGEKIGVLTSGGFSPTLKESIGMGYVPTANANIGEKLIVSVRDRDIPAEVVKMPFMPAKTKTAKKQQAA